MSVMFDAMGALSTGFNETPASASRPYDVNREGFVIEHNASAVPGQGSCIFAHLWRQPGEATAGCTAMAPERMSALLEWLSPQAKPLFVLLPQAEYQRLQHDWELPLLADTAH